MDLTTNYLGVTLKNPIVPSASPLSASVDGIRRLEDAGASAVVLCSLFQEGIASEGSYPQFDLSHGTDCYSEWLNSLPETDSCTLGPDEYLELIRQTREAVSIPIIGSLNGTSTGRWIDYARSIQEAGAAALELNVYYIPTSTYMTGSEVESIYTDVLHDVKSTIEIPLAMKLTPFLSSTANVARRLADGGADGLVMFNRFYQPDLDLEKLEAVSRPVLSTADEMRLPLYWVALLYGQINVDFAISSGVHSYQDVIKGLLAGAKVTMMASELLKNGVNRIGEILDELEQWMEQKEISSVRRMIGSLSRKGVLEKAAVDRGNYVKMIGSYGPVR